MQNREKESDRTNERASERTSEETNERNEQQRKRKSGHELHTLATNNKISFKFSTYTDQDKFLCLHFTLTATATAW